MTSFDSELGRLADAARRVEATRSRRQRTDRSVSAELSATFFGTLTELLETRTAASVLTRSGNTIRGSISELGGDVVVVDSVGGTRTLIRLTAIEGIRHAGPGHNRDIDEPGDGPTLGELLDELSQTKERVALTLNSGNKVMGVLDRVGFDQLVLRLDGESDGMTVPLMVIDHVVIER